MATTERAEEASPAASDVAASCRETGLVRLVGAPRGDALAAVGLLARALDGAGIPFQAGLDRSPATDGDATVGVGRRPPGATHSLEGTPVAAAYAVAAELSAPDPVLGLAGTLAREGVDPGRIREDADVGRRPGVAVPTADVADGLAHSTLVHGPFSGDPEAAGALADGDGRDVASAVALAIGEVAAPASRAGAALERFLRPHAGGPFETVGGYADVLDALARRQPGLGLATALGSVDREAALDAWRTHAADVHRGVEAAETRRHDGLVGATVEGVDPSAIEPIARLLRDFRSPEPAVLVRGAGRTALATGADGDALALLRECLADRDAEVGGHAGVASTPLADADVESAVRRAL